MPKRRGTFILASLLLIAPGEAHARNNGSTQSAPAPQGDIASAVQDWLAAFNDLDEERFIAFFSPEATVFAPALQGGPATGKRVEPSELKRYWAQTFRDLRQRSSRTGPPYLTIKATDLRIDRIADDGAVITFHLDASDEPGRRTIVWRREPGGWRILHLHASRLLPAK